MPPSSRVPPLLQPFVRLPEDGSIVLLTSTLGASANWLLVRFLCDALGSHPAQEGEEEAAGRKNVILVSWMRDYEFWKQEARKGGGLDLEKLRTDGQFAFVDGLSRLFLQEEQGAEAEAEVERRPQGAFGGAAAAAGVQSARASQTLPARGPPVRTTTPARGPPPPPTAPTPQSATTPGLYTLRSPALDHLLETVKTALAALRASDAATKTLIVLDNPDILLATDPTLTPSSLTALFLTLQSQPGVSHLLTHLQADTSLLALSTPPQPLEIAQHNLIVKMGHMSRRILSVRVLDTGVARDVSGVLRGTENVDTWRNIGKIRTSQGNGHGLATAEAIGMDVLYKVNGDGSVKVFERGAGGHV